jgi:SET and MYND domain-containing protein
MDTRIDNHLNSFKLRIDTDAVKGRLLRATKAFSPGDLVFSASPLVSILRPKNLSRYCSNCFAAGNEIGSLKRCSQCKYVYYCSEPCQKSHWIEHKEECQSLVKIHPNRPTETLLLMARLLREKQKQSLLKRDYQTGQRWEDVEFLNSYRENFSEEQVLNFAQMSMLMQQLVDPKCMLNATEMLNLFSKFSTNNFNITNPEMQPIGIGLYPTAALLNHSCSPNCVVVFDGTKIKVRAIQNVAVGEEVTIPYVEVGVAKEERQKDLQDHFYFTCQCNKCQDDEFNLKLKALRCNDTSCPGLVDPDDEKLSCNKCNKSWHDSKEFDVKHKYDKCLAEFKIWTAPTKTNEEVEHQIKLLEPLAESFEQILCKDNALLIKIYDKLMNLNVQTSNFTRAKYWCEKSIPVYKAVYHPNWPLLGLQLTTLAKLESYLYEEKKALEHFKESFRILNITHSTSNELVQNLRRQIDELEMFIRNPGVMQSITN